MWQALWHFAVWRFTLCATLNIVVALVTVKKSNKNINLNKNLFRSIFVPSPRQITRIKGRNMFKNTFQSGFLSILYSIGSKPLQIWDKKVRNGHIKRITDNDIQSLVLEIVGTNVSTTYITCPADPKKTLGIKLPFLVMIIKNLKKYFTFEVQVSRPSK